MHIRLDVTEMTIDDMETLEGTKVDPSKKKWTQLKELLAHFCFESAEEDAAKIPYAEALGRVGALKIGELAVLRDIASQSVEELADLALPPETDGQSLQPSEE
jgi:hypothetical protein